MNLEINDDQQLMRDSFARLLDDLSSMERVRAAQPLGFDRDLWAGLAELGAFAMRVEEDKGGLGLGTFDAVLLMEEAGRTLATGPLAETLMAARLLATFDDPALDVVVSGESLATIAFHDIARQPRQWLSGGANADLVVALRGDSLVLVSLSAADRHPEATLASNGIGEVDLASAPHTVLATGPDALAAFAAAREEWKLLTAASLTGLSSEALRLAAAYASERHAFGVPIGTFQGLSHPMATLYSSVQGGKYLIWKVIHEIASGAPEAAAHIPLALWWAAQTAGQVGIQAARTFGGYGLSTEYDIHLYNLRAKAWPAIHGDPQFYLEEAGRRLYAGEAATVPDVGAVSIDTDLGEEARALAAETDEFFTRTLTPELKAHAHHSWEGHHPEVHKKLAEANLLFPAWPKAKGGRGATPYARFAALEVWAKHGWSNHSTGTSQMVAAIVDRFGSEKARKDVLEPILAGDIICSVGFSEPGSGSDVFAAKCKATRDGDGWRIDGTKMFTSGADIASYVLMLCRTDPDAPKHKGLTMFIVPLKAEGVTVQPVHTFQDERTNITFYDGVRIPDDYRLGEVNGGNRTMSATLELEQSGNFARSLRGLVRAAEELCREIQHDGKPLIEHAPAQMRLARTVAHELLSEMLGLRALWGAENKIEIPAAGAMSKGFTSDLFLADASDLLDLTAPLSLSKRPGAAEAVNLAYRFAHGATIWAGTSEVHRSMVAERGLGLPRSRN
ncbi:Acyl-CoA dehydrogenase [Novosphingobium sp. CF614]|uniref:acyl-CoA dehydrogenase family protein n=1 Tax=Novosphingobium sp. CF614 TaxID=1884364 RepID=UPI0008E68D8C|nr:acyl-CoA dehydrogenase [Novosphingobium sp. CF614]SFF96467.1 Acyl-CoA dehydrogenase [Novosphingobium sp. CF614]